MMSDTRLLTINQMILAFITLVAVLAFLFVLVLVPQQQLNATVVTLITTVLTVLTTVLVMQQTHFFKSPSASPGDTPNANPTPIAPLPAPTPVPGPALSPPSV